MSALRLGIIGAGNVVASFHMPVLAELDDVRVEWLCDLDEGRAQTLARRFGVPRTVTSVADAPDVDAVLVATPVGSRREIIAQVAARRWNAFVEKPFAVTPEDHEHMLRELTKHGRQVAVGLVRRFYVSTTTAREVVRRGLLGPVQEIFAGEGLRARKFGRGGDWYQSNPQASGGGVSYETGSHLVDQVLTIVDAQRCELRKCRQKRVNGLEMETRLVASVTVANGTHATLTLAVSRLEDIYNGILVRCRNGEIRLGLDPEATVDLCDRAGVPIGTLPGGKKPAIYAAVRAEWAEFLQRCRHPVAAVADTGLMTTQVLADAYARGSNTPLAQELSS